MELSYILNELGEDRELYFNAVSPPIMQSSNFAFATVDEFSRALQDEHSAILYSRGHNPTVEILRKKLAALDGAEDCLVFNSGASAIFAAVLANVKAGDHILSVAKPYTWAQRMFDKVLSRFGVECSYVDMRDNDNILKALRPNTRIIYLESPNSWDFAMQDLAFVAKLCQEKGIISICDNSYATPLYQEVLGYGIDLSLQSATKYIGGHSDVVAGVLSGSKEQIRKIFESELLNMGNGISPFNAWLLIRGLRTLPLRLERVVASTEIVLAFLKQRAEVERIIFPHDPDFPQYVLAKKQLKKAGGLFSVVFAPCEREQIVRFCESLKHFLMAVSWGGHESLVIPKCVGVSAEEYRKDNPEHRLLRIYIGLEEPEYLIHDLEQAFAHWRGSVNA